MGMNRKINFVNRSVQFSSRMAFANCPPGLDIPKPFFYFQLGTELGNTLAGDDFPNNYELYGLQPLSYAQHTNKKSLPLTK
jgi:hypothetical protein